MLVVDMYGHVLACYSAWDIHSVEYAERWIRENGYKIYKFETTGGYCVITVRR